MQNLKWASRIHAGPPQQPRSPVVLKSRANTHIKGKKGKKFSRLHSSLLIPPDWAHLTLRQRNCKSQTRPGVPTSVCTPPPAAPASVHPSILLPSTSSRTFPPNAHIAEITVESNEGQKKFPRSPTSHIFCKKLQKNKLVSDAHRQHTAFPTAYSGPGQR